jgi:hypothetical protein
VVGGHGTGVGNTHVEELILPGSYGISEAFGSKQKIQ